MQLASRNERPSRAVTVIVLVPFGLDVRVDRIRDPLVSAVRLMLVDQLQTDPRDVGYAEAMDPLDVYAELAVADASAAERYPGTAAHLRACGPSGEDIDGLLAAVRGAAD